MLWVIKDAYSFYRANFFLICAIFLPFFIPELLATNFLEHFVVKQTSGVVIKGSPIIVSMICSAFYSAGLIFLYGSFINGPVLSLKECINRAIQAFPPYFITTFAVRSIVGAGLILLIIPGLIFAARLSLAQFYVILSGDKPFDAIKHSFQNTKGVTKQIIYTLFIAAAPLVLFIIGINTLPFLSAIYANSAAATVMILAIDIAMGFYALFLLTVMFRIFCFVENSGNSPEIVP